MSRPQCDAKKCCFCVDLRKGCMVCAICTIALNVVCILFNFSLWNFVIVSFAVLASVNLYNGARMYQPRMIRPFVTYSTLMGAFNLFFASYYAMSAETYCTSYYTDEDVDLCNTLMWSFYIPYYGFNAFYQLYFAYMAHSFYTQLLRGDIPRPTGLNTGGELSDATTQAALAATMQRHDINRRRDGVVVMAEPVDTTQYQNGVTIIQGMPVEKNEEVYSCETVTSNDTHTVSGVDVSNQRTTEDVQTTVIVGPSDVTSVDTTRQPVEMRDDNVDIENQNQNENENEDRTTTTHQEPALQTYL